MRAPARVRLPAKLLPPRLPDILHRERLYECFDRLQPSTMLWLAGPAGSGKTTLVAGYAAQRGLNALWYRMDAGDADVASFFHHLTLAAQAVTRRRKAFLPVFAPECWLDVEIYARRFFQALAAALPSPLLLVFDNVHDVPPKTGSSVYDALRCGLEEMPSGIRIVLVSRELPPAVFARAYVDRSLAVMDWAEIKLTESEAVGLAHLQRGGAPLALPAIRRLHAQTDGWIAGLILRLQENDTHASMAIMPHVFDYFAGEIFDRTAPERQEFLLKSVFLPSMTPHTVQALTGVRGAGRYLAELHRQHHFVERKSATELIYQYHPLFRDFLRARAEEVLSAEALADIRRRAVTVLESAGEEESALDLSLDGGEVDRALRLLLALAPRVIAQGRYQTLAAWLERFPALSFQRTPQLQYWRGMSRLPFDPADSRADFEGAFHALREQDDDPAGIFQSWAGFVEATLFVANEFAYLDRWIADLETLVERFPDFPDPMTEARVAASMTIALVFHRPDHPSITQWAERAATGAAAMAHPNLRVLFGVPAVNYVAWMGDPVRFQSLMTGVKAAAADPRAAPLARILSCVWEGLSVFYGVALDPLRRAAEEGLAIAAEHGVHVQDFFLFKVGIVAAIDVGDVAGAAGYLARMRAIVSDPQMTCHSLYYYSAAWVDVHQHDWVSAAHHIEQSRSLAVCQGLPFPEMFTCLLSAHISGMRDMGEAAAAMLAAVRRVNEKIGSKLIAYMHDLCEAHLYLVAGGGSGDAAARRERGFAALRRAMTLSRERGFFSVGTFPRPALAQLCAEALSAGIESGHVAAQVRRHRLAPPDAIPSCPEWPGTASIRVLGGFELRIDGRPLEPRRKMPRKPLALLQALIAAGGRDVRVDKLTDALWPEAEGDAAHWSFAIALRRLRALLGVEEAVTLRDKKISLDPRHVWIDAWVVESLLERVEAALSQGSADVLPSLMERLLTHYRGDFLDGVTEEAWSHAYRQRLRRRFVTTIENVVSFWERRGESDLVELCRTVPTGYIPPSPRA